MSKLSTALGCAYIGEFPEERSGHFPMQNDMVIADGIPSAGSDNPVYVARI
jgi:hypothetical protein